MRWYTQFPKTLFRLSPNGTTKLRDYALRKSDSFDVQPINGLVQPLDDMTKYTGMCGMRSGEQTEWKALTTLRQDLMEPL